MRIALRDRRRAVASKHQLGCKPESSRTVQVGPRAASDRTRYSSEIGVWVHTAIGVECATHVRIGSVKVRGIGNTKSLRSKLQCEPLGKSEIAEDASVQVGKSRPSQEVAVGISIPGSWRRRKYRWVEIVAAQIVSCTRRTSAAWVASDYVNRTENVGGVGARTRGVEIIVGGHGEWQTAQVAEDAIKLPTAGKSIGYASVGEALIPSKWQFVQASAERVPALNPAQVGVCNPLIVTKQEWVTGIGVFHIGIRTGGKLEKWNATF